MSAMKGTVLVTGANGGLGSAIAKQASSQPNFNGYHSLFAVRDATKASALRSALSNASHPYDVISLDLTNLDNVRQVAEVINSRVAAGEIPPIQALILNAGFQDFGKQIWTEDGFDVTFIANYLGHWLLTLLLLKSMNKDSGRIVVIGSQSHDPYDKRNDSTEAFADEKHKTFVKDQAGFEAIAKGTWSSAQEDPSWRGGYRRYGASKLFLIMMIHELQRRMSLDPVLRNVCILGVDPGTMTTGLQRHASWMIRVLIFQIIYPIIVFLMPNGPVRSTQKSGSRVLHAAFESSPELGESPKGLYFLDEVLFETSAESRDVHKRNIVWKETVKYKLKHLYGGHPSRGHLKNATRSR
ncbi:putative short-chain dehydrogenase [Daldinia decipiens]|uniref:putative short-chain dehydrogenase n=1 Tax=Daldinia decipiens TaxID=326647 RepID=UPI0020C360F3|nr:putative short-chain dehydrogenase [Daldinia decipiens]KAI1660721.1 putative short-chain dehydrogenase [Daldinia decipiens]